MSSMLNRTSCAKLRRKARRPLWASVRRDRPGGGLVEEAGAEDDVQVLLGEHVDHAHRVGDVVLAVRVEGHKIFHLWLRQPVAQAGLEGAALTEVDRVPHDDGPRGPSGRGGPVGASVVNHHHEREARKEFGDHTGDDRGLVVGRDHHARRLHVVLVIASLHRGSLSTGPSDISAQRPGPAQAGLRGLPHGRGDPEHDWLPQAVPRAPGARARLRPRRSAGGAGQPRLQSGRGRHLRGDGPATRPSGQAMRFTPRRVG